MWRAVWSLHFHQRLLDVADSGTFHFVNGERAPGVMTAQSDPGALYTAAQSPQATVSARARRVLIAIGADALPEPEPRGKPAAAAAAEAEADLLGGLGDDPAAPAHPAEGSQNGWPNAHAKQQQQQQRQAIADVQDDLLGELMLPSYAALLSAAWPGHRSSLRGSKRHTHPQR